MCCDETKEKLESKKLLLQLHLKYIIGISFGCICLVIILSFCEDSVFKSCVSVASTVTSIILSVIAIILSVTGERTTNEIRNKVTDSVGQLEDCANKSSILSSELSATLQQMRALYDNMNDKIGVRIPQIQATLNDLVINNGNTNNADTNETDIKEKLKKFFNSLDLTTKVSIKKAYIFLNENARDKRVGMNDIMQYLLNDGIDSNTVSLTIGILLGLTCTGALIQKITVPELIEIL